MPAIVDAFIEPIAEMAGFPLDQIKLIIFMLLGYPIAGLFRYIKGNNLRHAVSLVIGVFYAYAICEAEAVVCLVV